MTVSLLHKFHSAQPDDPDATLIRPSNWNDQHNFTGTPGMILGFDGSGNAIEVSPSGGATSPAAPSASIQFNNSGFFGGDANFTWTPGSGFTNKLSGIVGNQAAFGQTKWFPGSSTSPYNTLNYTVPSSLLVQQLYTGDLSAPDSYDGVAGYLTMTHTGASTSNGFWAGDFLASVNPESTGPFSQMGGVGGTALYAGAGLCSWIYGAFFVAGFSPPTGRSDVTGVIGAYALGESQNVNPNTSVYGLWGEAHLSADDSSALQMIGVFSQNTLDATATHTPLSVSMWAGRTLFGTGTPAATNVYGVYIDDQTSPNATNSWNLYSFGAASQNTFEGKINLGLPGSNTGNINFDGKTSGVVKLSVQDVAGTWTMKLPTTAGTSGWFLQTDGSGNTTWAASSGGVSSVTGSGAISVSPTTGATVVSVATATSSTLGVVKPDNTTITISGGTISAVGSAATIVVNTSTITGGTTGHVAYDNAGTFGEAAHTNIVSGQINVDLGSAYLYATQSAIFAVDPGGGLPYNWFFGGAGNFTVTGDSNFIEGPGAGAALTTGIYNMVEGAEALHSATTGRNNLCFGRRAGYTLTDGSDNTFVGTGAGQLVGASCNFNVGIGTGALGGALSAGVENIGIGNVAGQALSSSSSFNVFIGSGVGQNSTGTSNCTFIGNHAAQANVSGQNNTGIGGDALHSLTTGQNNVTLGRLSGYYLTGGGSNTLIGERAGFGSGTGVTSGDLNTFVGAVTGGSITTGTNNLILGDQVDTGSNVSNCIVIGCNAVNHLDYNLTTASTWTTHSNLALANGKIQCAAGTTSYPSINIAPGVAPTSPADGDYWYDGTALNFRHGGTTSNLLAGGGGGVSSGVMTANGAVYATGASAIASTAALTNGQILIGSTGVAPVAATIAISGSGISVTNGAGTITLANTGVTSAVAGTGITVSGATGAVTIGLSTPISVPNGGSGAGSFTAHGLLLGEGTSAFGVTAVGTTNQILIGQSAADPIWTSTLPTAAVPAFSGGDVTSAGGSLSLTIANAAVTNAKLANMPAHTYKGNNTGSSAAPLDLTQTQLTAELNQFTTSLQGVVPGSGGGTTNFLRADGSWAAPAGGGNVSAVSLTTHGVIIGSGTTAITSTAVGTTNQILIGQSAADPIWTSTLPSAAFGPLTGDVTTSGYAATLANIPNGTPAAGSILHTNIAAPGSPAAGKIQVYTDSTNNILAAKNSSGTVSNTVVPDTGAANNFLTAISAGGVISKAQPSFANLSGSIASTQMPAYTGDVTSSAGATVNTLVNIPTGVTAAGAILFTNITAPASPAAGKIQLYTDTTNNILSAKNSAGTVSNTVVPATAGANQFATAVSAAGVISFAQPSVSNLSGLPVTVGQGGTGQTTLTAHGVLIGEGTSGIAATSAGTANQILISGGAAADPSWTTTLPTAATPAYTGDVTSSAGGTVNTLASVITAGGPTGNATTVPVITYDAKGRLTAVTTATIAAGTANVDPSPQTNTPTTGFSLTMTGWNLILTPAGTLASGTITMPASPVNGQIACIRSTQPISSLSWNGNTKTVSTAPNTLAAGQRVEAIYISATSTWYFAF